MISSSEGASISRETNELAKVGTSIKFTMRTCKLQHDLSHHFWIPMLSKGGPCIELPSLRGMWVQRERLLMAHLGKR